MAPNIRDAERARTSTCAFADRVARTSIHAYRSHAEHELFKECQTVLAAFLVHDAQVDELQVRTLPFSTSIIILHCKECISYACET